MAAILIGAYINYNKHVYNKHVYANHDHLTSFIGREKSEKPAKKMEKNTMSGALLIKVKDKELVFDLDELLI